VKVVIPGGSGQVGAILARALLARGDDVVILSRGRAPYARVVPWDGRTVDAWAGEIDGADVVINLAGRSVNCRYNARNRAEIFRSRLETTADQPVANPSSVPGAPGTPGSPDPVTGYGLVDPYRAVSEDLPDELRPDPSNGPGDVVSPADAALPGHDRDASRLALGVSAAGVLALATPVALLAARRGRVKGSRAGV